MITTWADAYQAFDDWIDETYVEPVVIDIRFQPSRILRECDPVAYRCYFNDWADGEGIDTDELTGYPEHH